MTKLEGNLRKMEHKLNASGTVEYNLRLKNNGDELLEGLNKYLGSKIKLEFLDLINCIACGRKSKKTFNQGYCYPCFTTLAECDSCIIKPETCHHDLGTCRDEDFAESHCNISHTLYLSLTSGLKVGVTRSKQELTRWVDQGASKAIRLLQVKRRKDAGLLEVEIAKEVADKTNWRKMLKNEYEDIDLVEEKAKIIEKIYYLLEHTELGESIEYLADDLELFKNDNNVQEINYPALNYPQKIKSFNFDKEPVVEGRLEAIKGQYLILDTGVINLRKFGGYKIAFTPYD